MNCIPESWRKLSPNGWVFGGELGWVLGWVLEKHPPINFSLSIAILRDLGGSWGVFRKNFFREKIPPQNGG